MRQLLCAIGKHDWRFDDWGTQLPDEPTLCWLEWRCVACGKGAYRAVDPNAKLAD